MSPDPERSQMTSELAQAICNYAARPNLIRRELVVRLVRDGHLNTHEYKRLAWALEPHTESAS
jgi:hypothetical protein